MAGKKIKRKDTQSIEGQGTPAAIPAARLQLAVPGFSVQAVIVALLAVALYANTFTNEFALDDNAIIVKNEFVHQGFAGIPDILTKDAYYSYFRQMKSSDQLTGGRYRPLSIVTFAIEQQFFGAVPPNGTDSLIMYGVTYDMHAHYEQKLLAEMRVRHVVNVLLYGLLAVALLVFFRNIVFKDSPWMALIAAILFVVHPLHTEVVANVKSRDEILSLLFICLTFIYAFKYTESGKSPALIGALCCFFLAFLSKEYAITLLVLLPLAFYLFKGLTWRQCIRASWPYFAVALLYLLMRFQLTGVHERNEIAENDIQINPYALASGGEKLATEIATSLNYIKLLVFPQPLSSDYSYNQIPYKDFSHPLVWLSLAVYASLVVGFFYFLRKRQLLSFAIAFYLLNLLMVCNIVFDIGATMGERLIFHASVGFVIAAAYLLVKAMERMPSARYQGAVLCAVMAPVLIFCTIKTIARNRDWKNDESLFFHDVRVSPNSFLINVNVAVMLVNGSDTEPDAQVRTASLRRAVTLFSRAIEMQDNYVLAYMNRSIAWLKLEQPDSMRADLDKVLKLYPIHPVLPSMYYHNAMLYYARKQYQQAQQALSVSLKLDPNNPEARKAWDDVKKQVPETSDATHQ